MSRKKPEIDKDGIRERLMEVPIVIPIREFLDGLQVTIADQVRANLPPRPYELWWPTILFLWLMTIAASNAVTWFLFVRTP